MTVPALDDESIARIETLVDTRRSARGCGGCARAPPQRRAHGGRAACRRRARVRRDRRAAALQRRGGSRPRASRARATESTDGGKGMSQIPFVNQLGDELERAAERAQPGASAAGRRRRLGLLAVGAALLVSGSAIAGGLFSGEAEHQATASVACYDGADGEFQALGGRRAARGRLGGCLPGRAVPARARPGRSTRPPHGRLRHPGQRGGHPRSQSRRVRGGWLCSAEPRLRVGAQARREARARRPRDRGER